MSLVRIKAAFSAFRTLVHESKSNNSHHSTATSGEQDILLKQIEDLKSLLAQRDSEINILVNMVKKGKQIEYPRNADLKKSLKDDRILSDEKSSLSTKEPGEDTQIGKKVKSDHKEMIVKKHLFGVAPPTEAKVFEDAAGE